MTSVLVVAPLAVVLADDTLRKWFGASLAVRARPSRSPKAAPTVAVSQPAESPTLANSKTHSHGHPRWYSIGYKRSLRFFSKSTPTEHLPHLDLRAPYLSRPASPLTSGLRGKTQTPFIPYRIPTSTNKQHHHSHGGVEHKLNTSCIRHPTRGRRRSC